MKTGIAVAGNMIVDNIKRIHMYPDRGQLANVTHISRNTGGAVCNVIMDLARLDKTLPLTALGVIGADELGGYILSNFSEYGNIDASRIIRTGETSFTDVMSEENARTFFHYRGSNTLFAYEHFGLDTLDVKILQIGYILLLDGMDAPDAEYGTVMARVLHDAQARGIRTSVDVVSEQGGRFAAIVPPSLKYCDYCIINEVETEMTTGVTLRNGGILQTANMEKACHKLKSMGVSRWAVVHAPEAAFGLDESNTYFALPSLQLPAGFIQGTVGAGDAFLAGALYGAYHDWPMVRSMELGIGCAACSLSEAGSTEGMRPLGEVQALYGRMPKQTMA